MAYGDTRYDETLKTAWADFCDRLKVASELVFRDASPATPVDRAFGFQYLSRYISRALDMNVEHDDPLYPQFVRHMTPTSKYGGDNPDALYLQARIDGEHTYRVVGNRGTVRYVVFSALRRPAETKPDESPEVGRLIGDEIRTEWDGSFQLVLSPDRHDGNWIKTVPGVYRLTVRQFFGDWEREEPLTVRIERVGSDGAPPALAPERLAKGLREAADFVIRETTFWAAWLDAYKDTPNTFVPRRGKALGGAPGGVGIHAYWKVQPDEALLIEVLPPRAFWWNVELNNYWMCSLDYRYRLSSVNSSQAVLEDDGMARMAVSHRDPGIPNWLDTGGFCDGHLGLRWMQADGAPIPSARLIKLSDLPSLLPATARRLTPTERREQMRRRKIGIDRRFRA